MEMKIQLNPRRDRVQYLDFKAPPVRLYADGRCKTLVLCARDVCTTAASDTNRASISIPVLSNPCREMIEDRITRDATGHENEEIR